KMGSSTLVKAASIDSLLNECIHAFDDSLELHVNLLPRTLLLMHRWYVPSAELAGKLLMIYPTWETHGGAVARTSAGSEFTLDLGLIRITEEEFRDVAARLGCEKHFELIDISTMYAVHTENNQEEAAMITFKKEQCGHNCVKNV
uniref:Uncharacterized protein n=1 Tax=Oryzias latipes TaxID=8090 RepID=A0A3P9ML04_ORYLA